MKIGLTGGIACGKTFVRGILENLGAAVISSDDVYQALIKPHMILWENIIGIWGRDILDEDLTINRKKLGKIIFSDQRQRIQLNAITHPAILEEIEKRINPSRITVLEIPLLFEAKLENFVNEIWVVDIPVQMQIKRLMQRDSIGKDEAATKINSQTDRLERLQRADQIIDNSRGEQETIDEVKKLWRKTVLAHETGR